jgi:hypothetical protein
VLPNLIIIGAAKAGTTALHQYLTEHPDVFMSNQKELQYFQRDEWRDCLPWYEQQFPVDAPIRGEASPIYTLYPAHNGVPERMRELVPDAKLIYLVRDPIERFVAHYVELFSLRIERRSFTEVAADTDPSNRVLAGSMYALQLEQYLACFTPSQMLVVDQCDLLGRRREALQRIFRFIGVRPDFWSDSFDGTHNTRKTIRYNEFGRWLFKRGLYPTARAAAVRLPDPLRRAARRSLGPPIARPQLTPDIRAQLGAVLAADAHRFRALTAQRFDGWSV